MVLGRHGNAVQMSEGQMLATSECLEIVVTCTTDFETFRTPEIAVPVRHDVVFTIWEQGKSADRQNVLRL